jgi:transcriptional regulator with XRE-family HTH domain
LAEHLRKRRLDLGLTQEEAAQRFGISIAAYNGWEGGRGSPSIGKGPKIFDFLGYDPSPPACSTFAEAVSALRRRLGLDKHQFAKRVDVDVKSVRNWESGKTIPFQKVRAILTQLGSDLLALSSPSHR